MKYFQVWSRDRRFLLVVYIQKAILIEVYREQTLDFPSKVSEMGTFHFLSVLAF
jgi:hypothetical protein